MRSAALSAPQQARSPGGARHRRPPLCQTTRHDVAAHHVPCAPIRDAAGGGARTWPASPRSRGTGKLTGTLVSLDANVIAVEPDPAMLTQLQRALPAVRALTGSAEAIPLPDGSVLWSSFRLLSSMALTGEGAPKAL
ncbi:class I SAM-dependent methyltransferase [Nocardia sp. CA-119907]|uniref:class I SAM-dependent methyltransferase n=1 Tax=Nocardia sp. CA-119907 TaxID=3239973 RepID=UPI003D9616F2